MQAAQNGPPVSIPDKFRTGRIMDVQVIKRHPYGGKYRAPGEVYTASRQHAKALIFVGLVRPAPADLQDEATPAPDPTPAPEPVADNAGPVAKAKAKAKAKAPARRGRPRKSTTSTKDAGDSGSDTQEKTE
jgi:hypothetical protein